ncbi:hypothetical protein T09_223 [Trichinella sp. T9]|nr:hypothetical protein T09_223 [Trichinella sp. T9]
MQLYTRCSIGSGSAKSRQVKQLSLTRLFSAESLGFPRSREGERALRLLKEQGRNLSRSTSANRIFSTCRHLPQLTNERFDPTYPPSVHSLVAFSTFVLSSPYALRMFHLQES